jgi:3'-phosphoadenosine 5'-phosphosulfate sulfotransferase (PAPS reductase)/FAD synthetase
MKHIVSFSGGAGSYMAAKRVIEEHGAENTLLVFTDTKIEDQDLYRFMDDTVKDLGAEFIKLEDGRDVWQVFFGEKYIGNTRNGNCTRNLKQIVFREWIEANYNPDECIVYLGIDWSEEHRYTKAIPHWEPYTVKAPLCEAPFIDKSDIFKVLESKGIEVPRLYKLGFQHNNCGGFCVKAGHGHFKNLLEKMPERFAYHEAKELEWQEYTGKNNTILRDRKGGTTKPLTLKDFREAIEKDNPNQCQLELDDFGGCGCYPY